MGPTGAGLREARLSILHITPPLDVPPLPPDVPLALELRFGGDVAPLSLAAFLFLVLLPGEAAPAPPLSQGLMEYTRPLVGLT
jgi:hypothetical protein